MGNSVSWLVERGQAVNHVPTYYWCGGPVHCEYSGPIEKHWTEDPNKATKFSTKKEAETLIGEMGFKLTAIATEHMWMH